MRTLLHLLPVILSGLVLSAHFLRSGSVLVVMACLAALLLLAVRERWAARLMQVLLLLGALEWIRTMLVLVAQRRSLSEPWIRMAMILSAVALFTAASALVFQSVHLKRRYSPVAPPRSE